MSDILTPSMTINGRDSPVDSVINVLNPATEAVIGCAPDCSREQLDQAVDAARAAFPAWRAKPYSERQDALRRIAAALMAEAEALKSILTAEQGKPHADALGEIQAAAWWITQVAEQQLPVVETDAMAGLHSVSRRVALGVVGAITPWNFPILLAIWKIGPALLAGNTMVIKPSPFTPLATLRLGEVLREALPPGVLNIVSGGDRLGPWITEHPGIDKVSFTGSTATGRRVMQSAAANLKRLTLELGGNDAAIVLDDVDVEAVAEPLFWAAFSNAGQVCVAAKRMYVHEDVYAPLAEALAKVATGVRMGDGSEQGVRIGPVQNRAQFERVKSLLADCHQHGYGFLTGGGAHDGAGYFVPITIVDNPPEDSRVVQEEAFGPVLPLLRFSDVDEVVARANASDYGLAGSVWSSDIGKAAALAERLETGTVWVNSAQNLTPFAAFAGRKQSGLGVENGLEGLLEFTAIQTVHTPATEVAG